MKQLNVGIIGNGKIGQLRRELIQKRAQTYGDVKLALTADINPAAKYDGATFYSSWREALQQPLDVVFACTTNEQIPDIVCEALQRGIHVFAEKPPGRSVKDVMQMRQAEMGSPGCKLAFGFNHRHHGSVLKAKNAIESGALGEINWLRGVYGKAGGPNYDSNWRNDPTRSGGGILIDQGIHMLDLFHLFAGEFTEVHSFINKDYWDTPVEDNAYVMMRSYDGKVATLHSSATQWKHMFRLEIGLSKGLVTLDGILSNSMSYAPELLKIAHLEMDDNGYPIPNPQESVQRFTADDSWELEVDLFFEAIHNNTSIANGNSADALRVMELIQRIYSGDKRSNVRDGSAFRTVAA